MMTPLNFKYTGPGYYQTRDGRKAEVSESRTYLMGWVVNSLNERFPIRWYKNGVWVCNAIEPGVPLEEHPLDLTARLVKLADTRDSKSRAERRAGSNPVAGTKSNQ